MFLRILPFVADIAAVNPNDMKIILGNGVRTFFINGKPFLVMVPEEHPEIFAIALFQTVEFYIILC